MRTAILKVVGTHARSERHRVVRTSAVVDGVGLLVNGQVTDKMDECCLCFTEVTEGSDAACSEMCGAHLICHECWKAYLDEEFLEKRKVLPAPPVS